MTRKLIPACIAFAVALALAAALLLALMPLWAVALLVNPRLLDPLSSYFTGFMIRQATTAMFRKS